MSKPPKPKYRTTNWSTYNDSLCQRGALLLWIDKEMEWAGAPCGQRGRSPSFSDAAIQFCLVSKNLYGLALRQTTGMIKSLLCLARLDWEVPDFSIVSRRQKHLQVTLTHQRRGEALHLLVDSTGIKMLGKGEWKRKKHGADYRRQWRKVHLGIDAQTLEVRVRGPETRFFEPPNVWGGQSGRSGAVTTGAAWSKPKCAVSSCSASA